MYIDFQNFDFEELKSKFYSDEYYAKVIDFIEKYLYKGEFSSHSSGSTGEPKEVFFSIERAKASSKISNDYFEVNSNSHFLLCLDIRFIGSKQMLVRAEIAGAKVMVVKPSLEFYKILPEKYCYSFVSLTPIHVGYLIDHNPSFFDHIGVCLIGSSFLSNELRAKILNLKSSAKFHESYGMTETLSHIAIRDISGDKPYFQILNEYQISVNSDQCMEVYHPVILPEKITTTDIVELKENNQLLWKGRSDNVINSSGLKLSPEYIEEVLSEYISMPFILAGEPENTLGQQLILILKDNPKNLTKSEIYSKIKESNLPSHSLPKEIYLCKNWVETESMKPKRKEIFENRVTF